MHDFSIKSAPATLTKLEFTNSTTAPVGPGGKATRVIEGRATIHLKTEGSDVLRALDRLFPGADALCKMVASRVEEDGAGGLDLTARSKLPELTLAVVYNAEPVTELTGVSVSSRPQLRVDEKGDAVLVLRPDVRLTSEALKRLCPLLGADIRVSAEPAQMELPAPPPPVTAEDVDLRGKLLALLGKGKVKIGDAVDDLATDKETLRGAFSALVDAGQVKHVANGRGSYYELVLPEAKGQQQADDPFAA